jgi:hypothetical protein
MSHGECGRTSSGCVGMELPVSEMTTRVAGRPQVKVSLTMDYNPRFPQPFTLHEAAQLDVTTIVEG